MEKRKHRDKLSNRINKIAAVLQRLPAESQQDILSLIQRHSCQEIKELVRAVNKIICQIGGLDERQARNMVERARDLNDELDQIRTRRGLIPDMV